MDSDQAPEETAIAETAIDYSARPIGECQRCGYVIEGEPYPFICGRRECRLPSENAT